MASKRKFDALPPKAQEAIRAATVDLTADWRKTIKEKTAETTEFVKGKGLTINEVDRAAYRKATDSVYKEFKPIVGAELFDAVLKEAGQA